MSRRRILPLTLAALAMLALGVATATATTAAKRKPRRTQDASLLRSWGFENGIGGWAGNNASLALAGDGVGGGSALLVRASGSGDYSVYSSPRAVVTTVAGATYLGSAWVRAATPGKSVCLRMREWSGNSVVGYAGRCLTATTGWQQLPAISYTARAGGRALDMYLYVLGAPRGDSFEVDTIALQSATATTSTSTSTTTTAAPTTTAPPTTTTAPPPPPTITTTNLGPSGLWAPDSPLNTPVPASAQTDPNSAAMVQELVAEANAKGWPVGTQDWSAPIFEAPAGTPTQTVQLTQNWYGYHSVSGVPIPAGAFPSADSDGKMVVIDRSRGCVYDLSRAAKAADGTWSALGANGLPIDSSGIFPNANSNSASGFAYAAGRILASELAAGEIDHALAFTMYQTKAGGAVAPATGSDGWSTAPGAIPEGARVQLDPSLDLDSLGLQPWQKTIARAMQVYGMYLYDTGGAFSLAAQHAASASVPYPWGSADYGYMPVSLVSHLRVLQLGAQFPNVYRYVPNRCVTMNP